MRPIEAIVTDKVAGKVVVKTKSGQKHSIKTDISVSLYESVILMFDHDNHICLGITTKDRMENDEPCYPVLGEFELDYDEDEVPVCVGGFLFPDE